MDGCSAKIQKCSELKIEVILGGPCTLSPEEVTDMRFTLAGVPPCNVHRQDGSVVRMKGIYSYKLMYIRCKVQGSHLA